jgi:15-cis-phytoene synthase
MNDLLQLVLAQAPLRMREPLVALWVLDAALGRIVATTTEPLIGQMRLTWWHDRLVGIDVSDVPAEPIITALAAVVGETSITGAALAELVTGWEALLEPMPLSDSYLHNFAASRGDGMFALSAALIGKPVGTGLGAGWALIDFAQHCSDRATAQRAWALSRDYFGSARIVGPRALRILARAAQAKASQPFDQIASPISRWNLLRVLLS